MCSLEISQKIRLICEIAPYDPAVYSRTLRGRILLRVSTQPLILDQDPRLRYSESKPQDFEIVPNGYRLILENKILCIELRIVFFFL